MGSQRDDVLATLANVEALAMELIDQLRAERDEALERLALLRQAIATDVYPIEIVHGVIHVPCIVSDPIVALARAHRQDSLDLDREVEKREAAEALAQRLTAELAEAHRAHEAAMNEVWEDVLRCVQRAWPSPHDYLDCPTELIVEVIEERDHERHEKDTVSEASTAHITWLRSQVDDLDLRWAASSVFIRAVVDALGEPQPEPGGVVDLPALAVRVVGQIERWKVEAERAIEEHEASLCPEDMGCAEYMAVLTKRAEAAKARLALLSGAMLGLAHRWDGEAFYSNSKSSYGLELTALLENVLAQSSKPEEVR